MHLLDSVKCMQFIYHCVLAAVNSSVFDDSRSYSEHYLLKYHGIVSAAILGKKK